MGNCGNELAVEVDVALRRPLAELDCQMDKRPKSLAAVYFSWNQEAWESRAASLRVDLAQSLESLESLAIYCK